MKTSKKILSILMSALIVLSIFAITGSAVTYEDGYWDYELHDKEVYIVNCGNMDGDIVIPEKLDGYPVVSIDVWTFDNIKGKITSITVPKTVKVLGDADFQRPLENVEDLEKYIVHKDNQYFSSDSDGVLYNKDKSILIDIPSNTSLKSYTYPDSVTDTNCDAFNGCKNLELLTISSNLEYLGGGDFDPFAGCTSIKKFVVASENPNFSSDKNGVLFDKDKDLLIKFPQNSAITEYTVPSSVTDIDVCAFNDCNNLKSVDLGKIVSVYNDAFVDCNNLEKIILPVTLRDFGPNAVYDCPKLIRILYEGTSEQWEKVESYSYDYDELYCIADEDMIKEKTTKAENAVLATDKNGVTVEATEILTDGEANITDNYDYNDNYNSNYDDNYNSDSSGDIKDKSDNKVLKIVLPIVAVVLVLIGIVVFFIIKDKKGKFSFKKPEKTQTKTVQKERTLSEDDLPGFVSFLSENKPVKPVESDYNPEDDDDFIPYKPEEEKYPIEDVRQEDEKTGSFFEYKPEMDNISQETQGEKVEESEVYEPEVQPDDKTQSWFDSTNI